MTDLSRYFAATEVRVAGDQPTLVDPYETRWVYHKSDDKNNIFLSAYIRQKRFIYVGNVPGVGEGVFAKKDIKKGYYTIVQYYFPKTIHFKNKHFFLKIVLRSLTTLATPTM